MSWKNVAIERGGQAARSLRVGLEAQAADHIISLLDTLEEAPEIVSGALDILFGEIANAQARRDLLRVADLLEYELPRGLQEVKA